MLTIQRKFQKERELDELETFVRAKKNKILIWTAVDHFKQGILGWVVGDHSSETFKPLWEIVSFWKCYFYVTDGWSVYPQFIPNGELTKGQKNRLLVKLI
jgi:IS1 family transposase